jgi:hypothetical protein
MATSFSSSGWPPSALGSLVLRFSYSVRVAVSVSVSVCMPVSMCVPVCAMGYRSPLVHVIPRSPNSAVTREMSPADRLAMFEEYTHGHASLKDVAHEDAIAAGPTDTAPLLAPAGGAHAGDRSVSGDRGALGASAVDTAKHARGAILWRDWSVQQQQKQQQQEEQLPGLGVRARFFLVQRIAMQHAHARGCRVRRFAIPAFYLVGLVYMFSRLAANVSQTYGGAARARARSGWCA